MDVAIVMPAYNEEACIENVINLWLPIFNQVSGVLIVVNDGSKDNTGVILNRLALEDARIVVIQQENAGHGLSVLNGYRKAIALGAEFTFQTDSDDQLVPADFWKLWNARHLSPFIIGHRKNRRDPYLRILITRVIPVINFFLFGTWIKDANIPFRLMQTSYLKKFDLPATRKCLCP